MSNIYFDIRGGALKVLITDGQTVKYTKVFETFSLENTVDSQKTLRQISDESGVELEIVHLIPPVGEVKIKTYKLQKMALEDARMIVKRRIGVDEGFEGPVFHLMPYGSGGRHQEFIAAIIGPEGLIKYVTHFSGYGIKIKNLSPSFHAKLKAFESMKSGIPQVCAIIEVGTDTIEIMVVSPSGIITHEAVPVTPEEIAGALEERDIERIQKKRLYGIIDALYKFMISYRENFADTPIEKVLLCGIVDNVEKIAGAVDEAIGTRASLWDPFAGEVPDGTAYTALYGLSKGVSDGTAVNLISAELLKPRRSGVSRDAMTVLFCICLVVIASICFIVETRYNNSKKTLDAEIREKKALDILSAGSAPDRKGALRRLETNQTPLYGIFRYLANNLPEGVSLDGIAFREEGEAEIIQLSFVSKYDVNVGQKRYFTAVIDSLINSGRLSIVKEPAFSVSGDAKNPLIHFQITCRTIDYDKNK
jgi:hypothetical protein